MADSQLDPVRIDVAMLVQRSVASLYSHLVTRPTGRAVRLAIESQLLEAGDPSVSVIDFSEVTILDYSCADEVVARLIKAYLQDERPRDAFFLFRGVQDWHQEPIEVVLERQSLAAVIQPAEGQVQLVGTVSDVEREVWMEIERRGHLPAAGASEAFDTEDARMALARIVTRRLVFSGPEGGIHSLGALADPGSTLSST